MKTTAERALEIIANTQGAIRRQDQIEIRRRIGHAGDLSDGTRVIWVNLCDRARYLSARTGWQGIIAELDQRDYWDRPEDMADALLNALERLEIMAGNRPSGPRQRQLAL